VNVFLTGALILIDESLELLAVVGIVELVGMVLLTAAASRKGELPVTVHGAPAHAHAPAVH
jgi:hypothetical protein